MTGWGVKKCILQQSSRGAGILKNNINMLQHKFHVRSCIKCIYDDNSTRSQTRKHIDSIVSLLCFIQ